MLAIDKGKQKETEESEGTKAKGILRWSLVCYLSRELLDVVGVSSDAVYLFGRLKALPISEEWIRRSDKISDWTALVSSSLGLMQVIHSRKEIWAEGRGVRREMLVLEDRLDKVEKPFGATIVKGSEEDEAELLELEKRLRERMRAKRRNLKRLREELDELGWERMRLLAEGVFAG